jgi:glycogen synthase
MKVLVLSNLYPPDVIGGYELGCCQVVDTLLARGHDVRVLTSAPRVPVPHVPHVRRTLKLADVWNDYVNQRTAPAAFHLNVTESFSINAFNVHALTTELEEFEPDVVYVWMLVGLGGLGLMGCLHHLQVPWVWHLMDPVPLLLLKGFGKLNPALAREYERQVRGHYLACSQQLINEIEAGGLQLKGEVEVIPNWVVGPQPPERTEFYRGATLRIASAGQIVKHKGIDVIIQSAALLRDRGYDNFAVDIYGKVNDFHFPRLVRTLSLGDHVSFKGWRTQAELTELYGGYDLFAFPTWEREPFAFAPLEAASNGCVPVLSQICGNAEWFVHGVHCLKAPRTAEDFAQVFQDILDGAIDLEPLGRRAAAVVRRDFHLDALIPKIERALHRASRLPRSAGGTAAEAYRMALLAEKLAQILVQEPFAA